MEWFFLIGAGLAEVGFTTSMKLSQGFKKLWPSLAFFALAPLSFWLLTSAMTAIPLGTAYAVWTGIGAVGTALVGILFFRESANPLRLGLLALLVATIVGLKFVS
jgi:quaternary ammonium compound-resistance protein SugE